MLTESEEEKALMFTESQSNLALNAKELKDAQTALSEFTGELSEEKLSEINPEDVELFYKESVDLPTSTHYSIWQAILEIVGSALRVSQMSRDQITMDDPTVYLVKHNSLNNIYLALQSSTDAIINEIESGRQFNLKVFLTILIIASSVIFLSMLIILPVLGKQRNNNEEVLKLFLTLKKKDIQIELNKARRFLHANKVGFFLGVFIWE